MDRVIFLERLGAQLKKANTLSKFHYTWKENKKEILPLQVTYIHPQNKHTHKLRPANKETTNFQSNNCLFRPKGWKQIPGTFLLSLPYFHFLGLLHGKIPTSISSFSLLQSKELKNFFNSLEEQPLYFHVRNIWLYIPSSHVSKFLWSMLKQKSPSLCIFTVHT